MTHFPTFSSHEFERDLVWARRHMTLTQGQATQLPDLSPVRLAVSAHLDLKTILAIEAVLDHSGSVFLTTCNPTTVRNHVVEYLKSRGAQAHAWNGMSLQDQAEAIEQVLAWNPTHLCEMGADLSGAIIERGLQTQVKAGLEATGSGISRLTKLQSAGNTFTFPIFNWDDLPIKEGLHNRHLVGLTTWHTFTERTRLSLHLKRVLVVGYGLVGQGVAATARALGGMVCVAERDPARCLEAGYAGFEIGTLEDLAPRADIIVTATGVRNVLNANHFARLKDGCFLLNVGHTADEIDVAALGARTEVIPFVEEVAIGDRVIYLFAGGSMANLTAGQGDSLNAFDLTLATMVAGIRFICTEDAQKFAPGVHALPRPVWEDAAREAILG